MGFFDRQLAYAGRGGTGPGPMPSEGLVFHASLSSQVATSESGHALTYASGGYFRTIEGVPCYCTMGAGTIQHQTNDGVPGLPAGASPRTLSCWVHGMAFNDPDIRKFIFGYSNTATNYQNAFCLIRSAVVDNSAAYSISVNGAAISFDGASMPPMGWQHVLVTYDGSKVAIWQDGEKTSETEAGELTTGWSRIMVGNAPWVPTQAASKGSCCVAACRIYNRVLAASEIATLAAEFSPKASTPFSYTVFADTVAASYAPMNMDRKCKLLIDWGDGTSSYANPGSGNPPTHTYAADGEYTISVSPSDGIDECWVTTVRLLYIHSWPAGLRTIRGSGFKDCPMLRRVPPIPKQVATIGNQVFMNCSSLEKAEVEDGSQLVTGYDIWRNCNALQEGYVPDGVSFNGYGYMFHTAQAMRKCHIPDDTGNMGNNMFVNCCALQEVNLPSKLYNIGGNSFQNCYTLELPGGLPSGVKTLGANAFNNCRNLDWTELPEVLTSIGTYTFAGCTRLALTKLPGNLSSIPTGAFQYCYNITIDTIPESITSIGQNAFQKCLKIRSIRFLGTPTSIHASAFADCSLLMDIYVPWAEGGIAGAPWGATRATIHYNSTTEP